MKYEFSCGAVVFSVVKGEPYYVLTVAPDFVCGFPKGHMEGDETEAETALREIKEETGLKPKLIDGFCERIEYDLPKKRDVKKRVTYFLARYDSAKLVVPKRELLGLVRLPFGRAVSAVHPALKAILEKADGFIRSNVEL